MIGQLATTALVQDKVLPPHQWRIRWDWNWPLWLSFLMTLAVVAWVVMLYLREASSAGKPVRTLLVLLRLTAISLVVAMLAQPAIEWFQIGRPRLVVLVDRSASMDIRDEPGLEGDRSRLEAYQSRLTAGKESLLQVWQSVYDLEVIAFDEEIVLLEANKTSLSTELQTLATMGTENTATRLGDAVDFSLRELPGPTPSAIILFTDGISTRGQSLEKTAQRARDLRIPLFPVAVGSPRKRPDVAIDNFLAEEVIFPGDRLQVEATIHATSFAGQEATLILRDMSALRDVSADQVLAQTTTSERGRVANRATCDPARDAGPVVVAISSKTVRRRDERRKQHGEPNRRGAQRKNPRAAGASESELRVSSAEEYAGARPGRRVASAFARGRCRFF